MLGYIYQPYLFRAMLELLESTTTTAAAAATTPGQCEWILQ